MGTTRITFGIVLGTAAALVSCAPKAIVVAEPPAPLKVAKTPDPVEEAPPAPAVVPEEDGLRMPDMLAMPEEGDLRSTNSGAPKTGSASSAVIARPPTEPSARATPKVPDGE